MFRLTARHNFKTLRKWSLTASIVILLTIFISQAALAVEPLMRFPDIHENTIVFVHGEDIWTVPATGGVAVRLTIHDGEERYPKFSPNGSLIAFTGQYDGNGDVYVMDSFGGDITRVTYHPGEDVVVGWHHQKNKIIFRSSRKSWAGFSRLFLISPDGTGLEELILHEAGTGSFSPDGSQIAYNKGAREHRTWKRYKGGTAQEVYIYDFGANEDRNISNFRGTDRTPMWIGQNIYFSSDRDRVLNIHAYNTQSGEIEQITHHTEYDVRRPSMGGNKVVYEHGGEIWILDVTSGQTGRVPIEVRADRPEVRPYLRGVDRFITDYEISPTGKRAVLTARGEVFTVPEEDGEIRNLTNTSGARSRGAVWSPDGKSIAYISDDSGEYEIYLIDPLGATEAVRLTHHDGGYRHTLRWSPDSKKIGFTDQTLRLYYLDVETGEITEVDRSEYENVDVALNLKPIFDYSWSPDSRYIAYSKMDEDLLYKVYIYSLADGVSRCISGDLFSDFGPIFSHDGKHLLFISNRRFSPTYCDFEWEMVYKNAAGIYALTLQKGGQPFLPFKSDEENTDAGDKESQKKDDENSEKDLPPIAIDFDGLSERIEGLPLAAGNYRDMSINDKTLYYLNADSGDFNRFEYRSLGPRTLWAFSLDERKRKPVIDDIRGYKLSADGSHIIYRKRDKIGIIGAKTRGEKRKRYDEEDSLKVKYDRHALNLSKMKMWLDPAAEWQQMFDEVWRMERDFYYEPGMHGMDWEAMHERYGRLLPSASCRQDMRFIIGELIGELSTSHTYVYGGDRKRRADAVNVGMLGVDWDVDKGANRYRFGKIFRVPDWTREIIPPLLRPGIEISEGDYLLQVNHREVTADKNIYSYFQDLAGKQVTLLVNNTATTDGSREYIVRALSSEWILRYLDWVEHNRMVAEKASGGQIGYIHLPDTYTGSAREFPKYYYGQTRKKGLIVDGRFNGGGLDPDIFLQRLDKQLLAYWTRRYSHDQTTPFVATRAHMVCLTNRQAGSGGDMVPWEFQQRGMGPVIGTRTWGGLVGVSMWLDLVDGGGVSAPDYRIYDPSGGWVVENEGVEPDIVVDLHPEEMARGHDAQLMKAIEVLMEKIDGEPRPWPDHEPFPVDR
jgi:tricorn protease